MTTLPQAPGCEESSAPVPDSAGRTFRSVLILPIADGLHRQRPNPAIERAQLVIIDRRTQAKVIKERGRVIEFVLIVKRIYPKLIDICLGDARHLRPLHIGECGNDMLREQIAEVKEELRPEH